MFRVIHIISTPTCPLCGGKQVYRAHRDGILDRAASSVNIFPYHCVQCPTGNRFYRFKRK